MCSGPAPHQAFWGSHSPLAVYVRRCRFTDTIKEEIPSRSLAACGSVNTNLGKWRRHWLCAPKACVQQWVSSEGKELDFGDDRSNRYTHAGQQELAQSNPSVSCQLEKKETQCSPYLGPHKDCMSTHHGGTCPRSRLGSIQEHRLEEASWSSSPVPCCYPSLSFYSTDLQPLCETGSWKASGPHIPGPQLRAVHSSAMFPQCRTQKGKGFQWVSSFVCSCCWMASLLFPFSVLIFKWKRKLWTYPYMFTFSKKNANCHIRGSSFRLLLSLSLQMGDTAQDPECMHGRWSSPPQPAMTMGAGLAPPFKCLSTSQGFRDLAEAAGYPHFPESSTNQGSPHPSRSSLMRADSLLR